MEMNAPMPRDLYLEAKSRIRGSFITSLTTVARPASNSSRHSGVTKSLMRYSPTTLGPALRQPVQLLTTNGKHGARFCLINVEAGTAEYSAKLAVRNPGA